MSIIEKFKKIAAEDRFKGWPLVGEYRLGEKIPFFGQVLEYDLMTGNGQEDYYSLIRNFGWVVVFGVNNKDKVITLVQWKPGVNQASWELPPGGIGKIAPGTSMAEIISTTKEIYLRETGYSGGEWIDLGKVMIETGKYRGPGPNDHGLPAYLMMATGLEKIQDARHPNRNEIMETLEVPLAEFQEVLASGLFTETSAVPCAMKALIELGKLQWVK